MAGVQCMAAKGDLPVEIRWTFNKEPLLNENGVILTRSNARTSGLNIDSLEGNHRGIYKCIARNLAGEVEYSAELFVNGEIF